MSSTIRPLAPPDERVLVVADWTVDAQAVVTTVCRRLPDVRLALVVPARLHGLDWAGDPRASCPCARRQVETIKELAATAGVDFELAVVGDPDPLAATEDALSDWPAHRLLLCSRRGFVRTPRTFDLAGRAARTTGLPVDHVALFPAASGDERHGWLRRRRGHCVPSGSEPARAA
jgi:hypothetical protein